MILEDVDVQTGDYRSRMISLANLMAAKRWKMYQATLDVRHAQLAEWWSDMAEQAIRRSS